MISLCILLLFGVVYNDFSKRNFTSLVLLVGWLSFLVVLYTVMLTFINSNVYGGFLNGNFILDTYSSKIKIIVLLLSAACIVVSLDYIKCERLNSFEYYILLLLALLGALIFLSSNSLLSMYLAIELQSLSLYVLAAFKRNSTFSTEAGLKYFILGAFSSGLILFGSSLIYGFTGLSDFSCIKSLFEFYKIFYDVSINNLIFNTSVEFIPRGIEIGFLFLLVGLLFKLGSAPFHMWVPDVYEGVPTSITTFFAVVPKVIMVSFILKLLCYSFYDLVVIWKFVIGICCIFSVIIGTFSAMYQRKLKRFLAYSSISHVGYMLLGLTIGSQGGATMTLLYVIVYAIMSLNIWSIVLSLNSSSLKGSKFLRIQYLSELNILTNRNPALGFSLIISLFSMAGVPPLIGFWAKWLLFLLCIQESTLFLMIFVILTSVVGAFYYIRIIKIMIFDKQFYSELNFTLPIDWNKTYIIVITTFFIIFGFFVLPFLYNFVENLTSYLFLL